MPVDRPCTFTDISNLRANERRHQWSACQCEESRNSDDSTGRLPKTRSSRCLKNRQCGGIRTGIRRCNPPPVSMRDDRRRRGQSVEERAGAPFSNIFDRWASAGNASRCRRCGGTRIAYGYLTSPWRERRKRSAKRKPVSSADRRHKNWERGDAAFFNQERRR